MRRRLGFTLSEVLVVMAIMVVLAGVLLPVLAQVRSVAKEKDCWNRLHQIQLAIMMYRSNDGGDGLFGPATEMGLPPERSDLPALLHLPLSAFYCSEPPNVLSPTQAVFVQFYNDRPASGGSISWADYATTEGENAVIFADMNHGDRSVPLLSPFFAHKGIGVRLNGQVFPGLALGIGAI